MQKYQIRWYAPGTEQKPVSRREFESLDKQGQAALAEKLTRLKQGKTRREDLKEIRDDIFEVRARVGNNHYRLLAFQDSPVHIIVLSCFFKNTAKTPKQEINKAIERRKQWRAGKLQ